MSAEEAIARAKAIAARLAGTGAGPALSATGPSTIPTSDGNVGGIADAALAAAFSPSGGGDGSDTAGSKRKRWGAEPDSSAGSSSAVSDAVAAALSSKRTKIGADVSKKVWIPVDKNPGYNYIGLLIGPGGSKQRELVNQSGGNVKISIRGRGSSSSNAVVGQPEEPLHVLLEGSEECVNNAEQLVSELLNDSSKAQAEKEKQLAVVSASKGADAAVTQGAAAGSYQPKPVAQLLGLNGNGHYGSADATELVEEKIGVPNGVVGFIIGKGGESITSMQRKSGCRVQIQKEFEMDAGSTQRVITLTAATQESINMCRGIIEEMVQDRLRLNAEMQGGRGMGGGAQNPGTNAAAQAAQLQHAIAGGHAHVTVTVPNNDVGLVIGKGGVTIRSIQERSGANLQIPQVPDADNPMIRTINITHPQKEGAEFAKTLVEEIMTQKAANNQYGGSSSNGYIPKSSDVSIQVHIPDKDVGMCIGKSGCVIREMQQRTQTKIQIPSQPTPGQPNRIATVTGSTEGCQKVQEIINRIIMEQSSQFVMTGAAFGIQGQQQYGGVAGQAQDYSAQWAAYYANAGYGAQGSATTTSTTSATTTNTTASTGNATTDQQQPAADAYYDAFFRYEYHYGEEAARKYYGAWSPPVGSANPYGKNPNQTSAPPPAAAPATAPAPAEESKKEDNTGVDHSKVRDSSVRNVSNLPAWMTKSG